MADEEKRLPLSPLRLQLFRLQIVAWHARRTQRNAFPMIGFISSHQMKQGQLELAIQITSKIEKNPNIWTNMHGIGIYQIFGECLLYIRHIQGCDRKIVFKRMS